jgi:hypothetical protein
MHASTFQIYNIPFLRQNFRDTYQARDGTSGRAAESIAKLHPLIVMMSYAVARRTLVVSVILTDPEHRPAMQRNGHTVGCPSNIPQHPVSQVSTQCRFRVIGDMFIDYSLPSLARTLPVLYQNTVLVQEWPDIRCNNHFNLRARCVSQSASSTKAEVLFSLGHGLTVSDGLRRDVQHASYRNRQSKRGDTKLGEFEPPYLERSNPSALMRYR